MLHKEVLEEFNIRGRFTRSTFSYFDFEGYARKLQPHKKGEGNSSDNVFYLSLYYSQWPMAIYAQRCSLTQCGGEMVLFNALTLNKQIEGKATTHISMFI